MGKKKNELNESATSKKISGLIDFVKKDVEKENAKIKKQKAKKSGK